MNTMALATVFGAALIGAIAGWVEVRRRPSATARSQSGRAAQAVSVLAILAFSAAAALAIADAHRADAPGPSQYMPVFALGLFLFYALVLAGVVAWPSAALAVWWLRRHRWT